MGTNFPTSKDAMGHLQETISEILSDGWSVRGIDPAKVEIFPDHPDQSNAMSPDTPDPPEPAASLAASGFNGDISDCCHAPAEQRGTCKYCTNCGSSNGCS